MYYSNVDVVTRNDPYYVYPTFAGVGIQETIDRLEAAIKRYQKLKNEGKLVKLVIHPHTKEDREAWNLLQSYNINLDDIVEIEASTNSWDEARYLKNVVEDNYTIIYTSDYHTIKWRILKWKYGIKGEVVSVPTNYSKPKKAFLYLIHTAHALIGVISPNLYKKVR